MRRAICTCLLLLFFAVPATAQSVVPTKATLDECRTGATPADRVAVFGAQMATIAGSKRLQVRFDLQERLPGASWERVAAPGLGVWRSSTADIFRYRKQVTALQAPADYRAIVRFRWRSADGRIIRRADRRTATCHQPDPGADLAVERIAFERTADPGRLRYLVTVGNDGRAAAGTFDVALTIGPTHQPAQTVEALAAGAQTVVVFVGPRCQPGTPIAVQVDPDGRLDERDTSDNVRQTPCPSSVR